jgi:hypothetical protein
MSKFRVLIALAFAAVGSATSASAQIVKDGGFESPFTGALEMPGILHTPGTPDWTFLGGSGLIIGNGTLMNTPNMLPGQGNQFAFLQANARRDWGYITQSITIPTSGTYFLSFLNSARGAGCCGGNTIFDVLLGTNQIGQFTTATNDGWSTKGASFYADAGTYELTFTTDTKLAGDNTTFIDNVSIEQALTVTATPEPASMALVATGLLSFAGIATRRKRKA